MGDLNCNAPRRALSVDYTCNTRCRDSHLAYITYLQKHVRSAFVVRPKWFFAAVRGFEWLFD